MTREPKIPMSPEQLPQQRIYEVKGLPERPATFDSTVGYGVFPTGALPNDLDGNATYLCQVEWAWSPMHNRLDAYYLRKNRSHWSLWSKYWDDNWGQWTEMAVGCVPRRGVSQKQAAVHLLIDFWKEDKEENDVDQFHWINEDGFLSISELGAISREVW